MMQLEGSSKPRYPIQTFHPHPEVLFRQVLYRIFVVLGIEYSRQDLGDFDSWDVVPREIMYEFVSRTAIRRDGHRGRWAWKGGRCRHGGEVSTRHIGVSHR